MADYKLSKAGVRKLTGENIPNDNINRHWREYQQWLLDGNTPDPADPDPIPATDLENATVALQRDPVFRALVKVLAARFGVTAVQMANEIKAQV